MNDPGVRAMEIESLADVQGKKLISLWPKAGQAAVQNGIDAALSNCPSRFSAFCPAASKSNLSR